ncbi:MAG: hypothetical protein HYT64_00805 [Candidatus Yanofskybacteria bacterium]|nr:hypothetical protein [Candidatus Yanofskybacteria bacterium]
MAFLFRNKKWFIVILAIIAVVLLLSGKDKNNVVSNDTETSKYKSEPSQQLVKNVPKPRGNRLLGMGITEGGVGFDEAFALAQGAGVKVVELPTPWDDSEPEARQYVEGWLPIANQFYPKAGIKLAITLNPIDTNNLRLPKDLKNKSFNDPEIIERYEAFVDFAAKQLPDSDVFFVAIGNEIDAYLGSSDKRWQEYTEFFAAVAPYVREKFPNVVIGSKITYDGVVNLNDKVRRLNNYADAVLTTYYPFKQGEFIVRDPGTVHEDFKRIVDLYPDKKIYFAEIGYPSGSLNGSSETKQADFIKEAFAAWDSYTDKIPFLNFVWLHDVSPEAVVNYQKYYDSEDKGFASFFGTLGLRTYDGKDKQAFVTLGEEVKKRGW